MDSAGFDSLLLAAQDVGMNDDETPRDRLLMAFELFEFGVEMMAANLRRKHPTASPEQIEELLEQWLAERPPDGDVDGGITRRWTNNSPHP